MTLASGEIVPYDDAVIATGSRPRELPGQSICPTPTRSARSTTPSRSELRSEPPGG